MLIVLEGPDGSGKSTLMDYLRKNLGFYHLQIRFGGGPPPTEFDFLCSMAYLSGISPPRLCDRIPAISEFIYGPTLRGEARGRLRSPADVAWTLQDAGCTAVVACMPPYREVQNSVVSDPQLHIPGVPEHLEALYQSYVELFRYLRDQSNIRLFPYDWTYAGSKARVCAAIQELHHDRHSD